MQIGTDTIRDLLDHPLHQADIEKLLRGLNETEKAQLFFRIAELVRPTSAVADIANRVSDSLSLDVLFPRLMDVVTVTLDADRSSLFLYDPETKELYSRVMQGSVMGEIRFPSDLGIAGSVFTRGEAEIITADAYNNKRFNQEVDRRTGYRTRNILCVPIRNKSREVIGVTQVLNKHTGDFDAEDQRLLEDLSQQAAAALENARLFEKVERQQREEATLLEVVSSIASETRLGPLLAKILAAATQLLDSDRGALFLYDPKRDELYSHVADGIDSSEIRFPANAGIAGECFTSGSVINILDAYMETPVAIYEVIGHHTDDTFPHREVALAAFTEGLSLYRRRDWDNAACRFRDVLTANPKDGPSRIYLERCEIFRGTPPAPHWDGVWTMQGKH